MALVLPDVQSPPTYAGQALHDPTDFALIALAAQGTGTTAGATVASTGGMALSVGAFTALLGWVATAVSSGSVTIAAGSSVGDRRDLVVWTQGTGIQVIAGTPCQFAGWQPYSGNGPIKPQVPASSVALCEVYVPAHAVSLSSANLIDKSAIAVVPTAAAVRAVPTGEIELYAAQFGTIDQSGATDSAATVNALIQALSNAVTNRSWQHARGVLPTGTILCNGRVQYTVYPTGQVSLRGDGKDSTFLQFGAAIGGEAIDLRGPLAWSDMTIDGGGLQGGALALVGWKAGMATIPQIGLERLRFRNIGNVSASGRLLSVSDGTGNVVTGNLPLVIARDIEFVGPTATNGDAFAFANIGTLMASNIYITGCGRSGNFYCITSFFGRTIVSTGYTVGTLGTVVDEYVTRAFLTDFFHDGSAVPHLNAVGIQAVNYKALGSTALAAAPADTPGHYDLSGHFGSASLLTASPLIIEAPFSIGMRLRGTLEVGNGATATGKFMLLDASGGTSPLVDLDDVEFNVNGSTGWHPFGANSGATWTAGRMAGGAATGLSHAPGALALGSAFRMDPYSVVGLTQPAANPAAISLTAGAYTNTAVWPITVTWSGGDGAAVNVGGALLGYLPFGQVRLAPGETVTFTGAAPESLTSRQTR